MPAVDPLAGYASRPTYDNLKEVIPSDTEELPFIISTNQLWLPYVSLADWPRDSGTGAILEMKLRVTLAGGQEWIFQTYGGEWHIPSNLRIRKVWATGSFVTRFWLKF